MNLSIVDSTVKFHTRSQNEVFALGSIKKYWIISRSVGVIP